MEMADGGVSIVLYSMPRIPWKMGVGEVWATGTGFVQRPFESKPLTTNGNI